MKIVQTILLLLFFFISGGASLISTDINSLAITPGTTSCPPNHEKAEASLKEYLSKEDAVNDLRTTYGFDIDLNSQNKIQPLKNVRYQPKCKELLKDLQDYASNYSVYRVLNYFFVVSFDVNNEDEFEFKSISIYNSDLEVVGVHFRIGTL